MPKMLFVHGSSAVPEDPESFAPRLFDYTYDPNTKKSTNRSVNSGLDAYGPGIYAFGTEKDFEIDPSLLREAQRHAGKGGEGSTFGFSLDMPELTFANEHDAYAIPEHEWVAVIEAVITQRRQHENYDLDAFSRAFEDIVDEFENTDVMPHKDDIDAVFNLINETTPRDFDYEMSDPQDLREWFEDYRDADASYADPMSSFFEEYGSVEGAADYVMARSDNLWETTKGIWEACAVTNTGKGYESFNYAFQRATLNHVSDSELLQVARVNEDASPFYVIFDSDNLKVEFADISKAVIDHERYHAMLNDIFTINEDYGMDLEKPQLINKYNQAARQHFGKPLSEETGMLLTNMRNPEQLYNGLEAKIIEDVGSFEKRTWYRDEEAQFAFSPDTPQNAEQSPTLSKRR
jgi:hypothetical protein